MKNNKLPLILILISLWIITILLGIWVNENLYDDILGNTRSIFYVFVVVNIIHLFYFFYIFYLRLKKRTKTIMVFASLPPMSVYIVSMICYLLTAGGGPYILEIMKGIVTNLLK